MKLQISRHGPLRFYQVKKVLSAAWEVPLYKHLCGLPGGETAPHTGQILLMPFDRCGKCHSPETTQVTTGKGGV